MNRRQLVATAAVVVPILAAICVASWRLASRSSDVIVTTSAESAARPTPPTPTPAKPAQTLPDGERRALVVPSLDELRAAVPGSLRDWVLEWTRSQVEGLPTSPAQIQSLTAGASTERAGVFQLVPLIKTIAFIDGGAELGALAEIVITRAKEELSSFVPPDPTPKPMITELWALHDLLWYDQQWEQDQRLMELLLPWEVRGSGHSQKVNFAYAENLYMQRKYDDAYAAFQQVLEERKVAFEPSQGVNRNIDWELGLCLYYSRRYAEAATHFRTMANNKGVPEGAISWKLAVAAFARSGQVELAEKTLDEWIQDRRPAVAEVAPLLAEIERAGRPGPQYVLAYHRPTPAAETDRLNAVISNVESLLAGNPRAGATALYKDRSLDTLLSLKAYAAAADFALQCINAQPDRTDRAEYFLSIRAQALLGAKRYAEALAAAKSYYNTCLIKSTPKAIELVAQVLAAAYPNDSSLSKRFKLQQLTDGKEPMMVGDISLGEPILKSITVDGSIYTGQGFELERNPDAQWLGKANMLLMQDQPEEARAIFERLSTASNQNFSGLGKVGLARAIKATQSNLTYANEYIRALESPLEPATRPAP